jgi:hypothetical protein
MKKSTPTKSVWSPKDLQEYLAEAASAYQRRVLPRRKPSLLCLRLKSAKQGCFHPRDVLPKQSTASAGFRMAARPLGQRIIGDPRGARVDRATTTGPLSPPSASNRVPAPVVDLGPRGGRTGCRTGCRTGGWGTALPVSAPGWQLGCMYQVRRETGRAPRSARQRVAPHRRPLLLPEWVRGGVSYKDRTTHPKFKARAGSSSL